MCHKEDNECIYTVYDILAQSNDSDMILDSSLGYIYYNFEKYEYFQIFTEWVKHAFRGKS